MVLLSSWVPSPSHFNHTAILIFDEIITKKIVVFCSLKNGRSNSVMVKKGDSHFNLSRKQLGGKLNTANSIILL